MSKTSAAAILERVKRTRLLQQETLDELLRLTRSVVAQQPETETDFVPDSKIATV